MLCFIHKTLLDGNLLTHIMYLEALTYIISELDSIMAILTLLVEYFDYFVFS